LQRSCQCESKVQLLIILITVCTTAINSSNGVHLDNLQKLSLTRSHRRRATAAAAAGSKHLLYFLQLTVRCYSRDIFMSAVKNEVDAARSFYRDSKSGLHIYESNAGRMQSKRDTALAKLNYRLSSSQRALQSKRIMRGHAAIICK
jgi:hypothetical protein